MQSNLFPSNSSIIPLLADAKNASRQINHLSDKVRRSLTMSISDTILANIDVLIKANQQDLARMDPKHSLFDRLMLTPERIHNIAEGCRQVANLPDPVGNLLSSYTHSNGLQIERRTVALGLVGAIYEARPNVTIDMAALCLRSGNGVVLKGGSDAAYTNAVIVELLQNLLQQAGFPKAALSLLPNERAHTAEFLTATHYLDVIVPRGSQGLIDYVRQHATVPVIETGAGVCHTYVHTAASLPMAAAIVANAKTQRPSVCNALDTVLVDREIAPIFLPLLKEPFTPFGVGIYADEEALAILQQVAYEPVYPATPEHFGREYLSQNCSIKLVEGIDEALAHIATYSSKHSEAIVTEDPEVAERFLKEVDAAAVYHNASTRFTDGGEFGLGAEMGISTQKLHARGPFALEKLVCEKWVVRGSGQVR